MWYIYIIFFVISFILLYIAEKKIDEGKKKIILEILAIGLLSFLAAIRNVSVGTDVSLYVKPVFELSKINGIREIHAIWYNVEIGYKIFNCVVAMFTSKFSVYLFMQQAFILLFAYLGIKESLKRDYSFVFLIYLFIFYNRSLNIVRQSMAISLCIYSLKFLFKNKSFKFLLAVFVAFLFHKTAAIFTIAIIIYKLYKKNYKNVYYMSFFTIIIGLIYIFLFPQCIKIMTNIGILSTNYLYYLDNYVDNIGTINSFELILNFIFMALYIMFNKFYKGKNGGFFFVLTLIDFICLIISVKYTSIHRLGMYFRIPSMLYFLSNLDVIPINIYDRVKAGKIMGIIVSAIFWYYIFVYGKSGGTVPFIISQDTYFYQIFFK